MNEWQPIETAPRGQVIRTRINDADGIRNDQYLKLGITNNLWWMPRDEMYVYYTPTEWQPEPQKKKDGEA